MDGVTFDRTRGIIDQYEMAGLYVEPIPEMFRRLRSSFEGHPRDKDNIYVQAAISDRDGDLTMVYIDHEAVDSGAVHPAFGGMSSVFPARNGLAEDKSAKTLARFGKRITVPCLSVPTLLHQYRPPKVDILSIDAEGHDWRIFYWWDLERTRPKVVRIEWANLLPEEREPLRQKMEHAEYMSAVVGQDLHAVCSRWWNATFEVDIRRRAAGRPTP
jgi:FkbM family methyltransferase